MSAPLTNLELTGNYTSLSDGYTYINTVAADTGALIEVIGYSYNGNPLLAITIGNGSSLLICTGCVHGNEPAGREMLLTKLRNLAYSEDAAVLAYLSAHKITFIPTVNPDSLFVKRVNAQNIDINRDAFTLETPEQKAIARYINQKKPHIILDCHERFSVPDGDLAILSKMKLNLNAKIEVSTYGQSLQSYIISAMMLNDYNAVEYPVSMTSQTGALSVAGLMGSVEMLFESYAEDPNIQNRVDAQAAGFDALIQWHNDNSASLAEDLAETNISVLDTYRLYNGDDKYLSATTLDIVTPEGYFLVNPEEALKWFDVYGIKRIGRVIPMQQRAHRIIPAIFDSRSTFMAIETQHTITGQHGKINNKWRPVIEIYGKRSGIWDQVQSLHKI